MSSGRHSMGFGGAKGSKGSGHSKPRKPCTESSSLGSNAASDNTTGSQPEFIVEKITGKRFENGELQMQVKWKGFPPERSTWEPFENLANYIGLVADFEAELFREQHMATKASPGNQPMSAQTHKAPVPVERQMGPKSIGPNSAKGYTPKPTAGHKIGGSHKEKPVPLSMPVAKASPATKLLPAMHLQWSESSGDETPSCSFGKRASPAPILLSSDEEGADLEMSSNGSSRIPPKLSAKLSVSSRYDPQPLSMLPTTSAHKNSPSLNSIKEQARQWQAGKNVSKFGALLNTQKNLPMPTETVAKEMGALSISATPQDSVDKAMKSIHSMQLAEKGPQVQPLVGKSSKKHKKKSSKKSKKRQQKKEAAIQKIENSYEDVEDPLMPQTPPMGAPRSRSSSFNWKMPPCTTPFGLDRGLELDKVMHNFQVRDRLFLFVTWKGYDAVEAVPIEDLKVAYPAKVIEYFERMKRHYK